MLAERLQVGDHGIEFGLVLHLRGRAGDLFVAVRVAEGLQRAHPAMDMLGVGCDFSACLDLPDTLYEGPALVFYPGSSIGNFHPAQARALLSQARALCAEGGPGSSLLIGVDLVKPAHVLEPAYDDPLGVTAAFNRNLLLNVNRWLGSDFQPAQWRHLAGFNATQSRIEMHLQAIQAHTVRWPGGERRFQAGERLHTEHSYKWTPATFEALLSESGWRPAQRWTDAQGWFGLFAAVA